MTWYVYIYIYIYIGMVKIKKVLLLKSVNVTCKI